MAVHLLNESCVLYRSSSDKRDSFDKDGYNIINISNLESLENIVSHLNKTHLMEKSVSVQTSFKCGEGSADHEYNEGRVILCSENLSKVSKSYQLVKRLKSQVIDDINSQMFMNISQNDRFTFSYLKSYAEKLKEPQHLHSDDVYDNEFYEKNNVLLLVALQDKTQFCLFKGSHAFNSIAELHAESSHKTYRVPYVITLNKGEILVMNMKLLHCGWTTIEDNTRIHFCINFKNRRSVTSIPVDTSIPLFSGEAQNKHYRSIYMKGKKNKTTWLNNFGDKRKCNPSVN
jgi:hypothetical protein